jgi:uncharacterized protein (TIGR03435 family)
MKRAFILVPLLACGLTFAQNSTPAKKTFEATSIKLIAPESTPELIDELAAKHRIFMRVDNFRVSLAGVRLSQIVQMAYEVPQRQVVGPEWLSEMFDVEAKLPADATKDDVPGMLQTMLADRFGMVAHHDSRAEPVYRLTVAKDGPKFRESKEENPAARGCTFGFHHVCHKTSMERLASLVSVGANASGLNPGLPDCVVIDATGLTGDYDFTMDYAPAGPQSDIYSVQSALKALGLKLEPGEKAFNYVIVDHIERNPTTN